MIMFSIPKHAFDAVELLFMVFTSFNIAVEKLFCPVAATHFIVICHLVDYSRSKHVSFGEIYSV